MRSWSFVLCLLAAALAPQLAWGQDDFAAWLEEFSMA
jgi:hypothetical protein